MSRDLDALLKKLATKRRSKPRTGRLAPRPQAQVVPQLQAVLKTLEGLRAKGPAPQAPRMQAAAPQRIAKVMQQVAEQAMPQAPRVSPRSPASGETWYSFIQPHLRSDDAAGGGEFSAMIRAVSGMIDEPEIAQILHAREHLALEGLPMPEDTDDEEDQISLYVEEGIWPVPFSLRELAGLFRPSQVPGLPPDATQADLERSAEALFWAAAKVRDEFDQSEEIQKMTKDMYRGDSPARARAHWMEEGIRTAFGLNPLGSTEDLVRRVRPIPREVAEAFVRRMHRTLPDPNPKGMLATIGLDWGGTLTGVAILSLPTGRGYAQREDMVDIARIATDGRVFSASSALALWAMEHAKEIVNLDRDPSLPAIEPLVITYSLLYEHGTTYRALIDKGLHAVSLRPGKEASGARKGAAGTGQKSEPKIRWEYGPHAGAHDPYLLLVNFAYRSWRMKGRVERISKLPMPYLRELYGLISEDGKRSIPRDWTEDTLRQKLTTLRNPNPGT